MYRRFLAAVLAMVMVITMMPATVLASASGPSTTVEIFRTDGDVTMTRGTGREFSARSGMMLHEGFTVTTGVNSSAHLMLDDGSLIQMDHSSTVQISQASRNRLSVSLLSGNLAVDAEPQRGDRTVEVRIGNSALAIRGTFFVAENRHDGSVVYTMFEGSGEVDGLHLPARHVMYVHVDEVEHYEIHNMLTEIHELLPFNFEIASLFVLGLIVGDIERFVENYVIEYSDIERVYEVYQSRLDELRDMLDNFTPDTDGDDIFMGDEFEVGSEEYVIYTALNTVWAQNALIEARSILSRVQIATVGTAVPFGFTWVFQAEYDAFSAAIAAAEQNLRQAQSLDQVLAARTNILQVVREFSASQRQGTGNLTMQMMPLHNVIMDSLSLLNDVYISTDGSEIFVTQYWAPQSAWRAFDGSVLSSQNAIASALGLGTLTRSLAPGNVMTDTQARAETQRLQQDLDRFRTQLRSGTRGVDRSLIESAIEHALFMLDPANIAHSENGADIPADRTWWNTADRNQILFAIELAQIALGSGASPQELDIAFRILNDTIHNISEQVRTQWGLAPPLEDVTGEIRYIIDEAILYALELLAGVAISEDGINQAGGASASSQRGLDGGFLQFSVGAAMPAGQHWVFPAQRTILQQAVSSAQSALTTHMNIHQAYAVASSLISVTQSFQDRIVQRQWGNFPSASGTSALVSNIESARQTLIDVYPISDSAWDTLHIFDLDQYVLDNYDADWGDRYVAQRYWLRFQSELTLAIARVMRSEPQTGASGLAAGLTTFNGLTRQITTDFGAFDLVLAEARDLLASSTLTNYDPNRISFAEALAQAEHVRATATTHGPVQAGTIALRGAIDHFRTVSGFVEIWSVPGQGIFGNITDAMAAAGAGGTVRLMSRLARFDSAVNLNVNLTVIAGAEIEILSGGSLTVMPGRELLVQADTFESTHGDTLFLKGTITNRGSFVTQSGSTVRNLGDFNNHGHFENNGSFAMRTPGVVQDPLFTWFTYFAFRSDRDIMNYGEMIFWGNTTVLIQGRIIGANGASIEITDATGIPPNIASGMQFWNFGSTAFYRFFQSNSPSLGTYYWNEADGRWAVDGDTTAMWLVRMVDYQLFTQHYSFANVLLALGMFSNAGNINLFSGGYTFNTPQTIPPRARLYMNSATRLIINSNLTVEGELRTNSIVQVADGAAIVGIPKGTPGSASTLLIGNNMHPGTTWGSTVFRDESGNTLAVPLPGQYRWVGGAWVPQAIENWDVTFHRNPNNPDGRDFTMNLTNSDIAFSYSIGSFLDIYTQSVTVSLRGNGTISSSTSIPSSGIFNVEAGARLDLNANIMAAGDMAIDGEIHVAPGGDIRGPSFGSIGNLTIGQYAAANSTWGNIRFYNILDTPTSTPSAGVYAWSAGAWRQTQVSEDWSVTAGATTTYHVSFDAAITVANAAQQATVRLMSGSGTIGGFIQQIHPHVTLVVEEGATLHVSPMIFSVSGQLEIHGGLNSSVAIVSNSASPNSRLIVAPTANIISWAGTQFLDLAGTFVLPPSEGTLVAHHLGGWMMPQDTFWITEIDLFGIITNHNTLAAALAAPFLPNFGGTVTLSGLVGSYTLNSSVTIPNNVTPVIPSATELYLNTNLTINSMQVSGNVHGSGAIIGVDTSSTLQLLPGASVQGNTDFRYIDGGTITVLRPATFTWNIDHWVAPERTYWSVSNWLDFAAAPVPFNSLSAALSAANSGIFSVTLAGFIGEYRLTSAVQSFNPTAILMIPAGNRLILDASLLMEGSMIVHGEVHVASSADIIGADDAMLFIEDTGSVHGVTNFFDSLGNLTMSPEPGDYIWSGDNWRPMSSRMLVLEKEEEEEEEEEYYEVPEEDEYEYEYDDEYKDEDGYYDEDYENGYNPEVEEPGDKTDNGDDEAEEADTDPEDDSSGTESDGTENNGGGNTEEESDNGATEGGNNEGDEDDTASGDSEEPGSDSIATEPEGSHEDPAAETPED